MPLEVVSTRELPTVNVTHGCCTDGSSLFFCTWDSPAKIFKVEPETLEVKSFTLGTTLDMGNDIVYHNGYLWVVLYRRNLTIVRVDTDLSEWKLAVYSNPRDYFFPMSLALDAENDTIYCGAVYGGIFAIDVSDPDNVSRRRYDCPTDYNHALAFMDGALYGWGFRNFNWSNPKKPAFWKFDGSSFTSVDLEVSLTDDFCVHNGYVYGVSEAWRGQTQPPKVCKVDSSLNIEYLSLDEKKIGYYIDGIIEYKGRLFASCRSKIYPIVEIAPDFSEVLYLAKTSTLPVTYPDEGVVLGDYLFLQSAEEGWRYGPYIGQNYVHKLRWTSYAPTPSPVSVTFGAKDERGDIHGVKLYVDGKLIGEI